MKKILHNKLKRSVLYTVIGLSAAYAGLSYVGGDVANAQDVQNANVSASIVGLPDFTAIVDQTENAVVNIRTMETVSTRARGGYDPYGGDPSELFRFFFGPDFMPPRATPQPRQRGNEQPERTVPRGVGSGFIISDDGYIITNNHVISGASKILVTLNNGKEYTAKVIGSDQRTDIALLKIDSDGKLPTLKIGDSDTLKKGQWVLAIGSPFGLDSTVTSGIVSAINRDTGEYLPFIQTDVAVNPGNSGGPLINLNGEVVGVNSQIISQSGGFMGISLSIPIDEAMQVVDQLKENGKVTRGRIGVQIGEVADEVAKALGLANASGALVSNVEQGGPADKAGIQAGDVIIGFDGSEVKKWSDLPRIVGQTKPDTESNIEVWRRGKKQNLKITVGEVPSSPADELAASQAEADKSVKADRLGLVVGNLSQETMTKLRIKGGVQITEVDGPGQSAGLRTDDIILAVNDQDIKDVKQFEETVDKLPKDKAAALLIRRENLTQWVPVTPSK
ncbi:MAG: DegQ family serine endoprotease [Advenella sp.]